MTRPNVEVPPELSALIRLAQLNVPTDVQEMLTQGNPAAGIAPHILRKIILAARAEQREEDARIAEGFKVNDTLFPFKTDGVENQAAAAGQEYAADDIAAAIRNGGK